MIWVRWNSIFIANAISARWLDIIAVPPIVSLIYAQLPESKDHQDSYQAILQE